MSKKVAIVGFAPSWKEAPFNNPEWEIWVLNEMYKLAPEHPHFRADRWFEIHDLTSPSKSGKEHQDFLKKVQNEMPLYVLKKYDHLPNAQVFPWDDILKFFEGRVGGRYFTNSVSWFIALAIMEGYEEIALYGVDMATDSEYGWQRPSCEYWMGLADGMGIKFYLPKTSDLLKCTQLYALESNNRNRAWIKAQIGELKKRNNQFLQQEAQAQQAETQSKLAQAELRGAVSAYQEILKRTQ